ncbi:hypothetical protein AAKU52_000024 [Pedobacter sp. CG_S7]|uniref:glycoside hydrolase family 78 protein n=1 Tax=Pedobacter sp. CG_S7 TaxID=3143930 RepID=UPI003392F98A
MKSFFFKFLFSCVILLLSYSLVQAYQKNSKPFDLKCEHLVQPIGVDEAHPRFSWMMDDSRRGAKQTAYRLYLSKDSLKVNKRKGDLWDTKKVNTAANLVKYNGAELHHLPNIIGLLNYGIRMGI